MEATAEKILTLPYPPSVNNLYFTINNRRVLSKEGRNYKTVASAIASRAGLRPTFGAIAIHLKFFRPRRAGDLDNLLKATLDSLKGIAWNDDSQVTEIHAERFEDKENPRAEIRIVKKEMTLV